MRSDQVWVSELRMLDFILFFPFSFSFHFTFIFPFFIVRLGFSMMLWSQLSQNCHISQLCGHMVTEECSRRI